MRVILVQDFPPLGRVGEVKEVADGYARNFLLPKKLALPATPQNLKLWEERLKSLQKQQLLRERELAELAAQLEGLTLKLQAKAGEGGRLYGAITASRIVEELDKLSLKLDKKQIELEQPIKEAGEYEVVVRLGGGLNPKLKLIVEAVGEG